MEAVILIGIQGAGKSTFCRQRLYDTHVRVNLDMLRMRNREEQMIATCLALQQPFVIDNTNPTRDDRTRYITLAKQAGFRVVGYYFAAQLDGCKKRNEQRTRPQQVPLKGLLGTYNRLQLPKLDEGFDTLFYVTAVDDGSFSISEWNDEV